MVCATSTCESSVGSGRRDGAAGTAPCSREPGVGCPAVSLLPADDPWVPYAGTIVQIVRPAEGDFVTVRSAPVGERRAEFGRWPWTSEDPVPILTAWDPGDERPGKEVNRRRGAELEAALRGRASRLLHAVGVDPSSGHARRALPRSGCRWTKRSRWACSTGRRPSSCGRRRPGRSSRAAMTAASTSAGRLACYVRCSRRPPPEQPWAGPGNQAQWTGDAGRPGLHRFLSHRLLRPAVGSPGRPLLRQVPLRVGSGAAGRDRRCARTPRSRGRGGIGRVGAGRRPPGHHALGQDRAARLLRTQGTEALRHGEDL